MGRNDRGIQIAVGIHFKGAHLFLFCLIDDLCSAVVRDMVDNTVVAAAGVEPLFVEEERHDILFFGIKENTGLTLWRDFVDFTIGTRGLLCIEIPSVIKFQRPDVFVAFVEQGCRGCCRVGDFINQSIGASASVERIVGSDSEAVNGNFR